MQKKLKTEMVEDLGASRLYRAPGESSHQQPQRWFKRRRHHSGSPEQPAEAAEPAAPPGALLRLQPAGGGSALQGPPQRPVCQQWILPHAALPGAGRAG
ncbi:hypothetical protein KUCAC02_025799 [Chaenocephalus aceratus]|uniref:Uncharacterized protein n=1 Tax=Chaenocephalus aceratus TaxID=36190 RepID=A0ACB9VWD9_CHAAC|nr:hypothetical protein KUCAC02_025799 [Chaenocephalus aceratus]